MTAIKVQAPTIMILKTVHELIYIIPLCQVKMPFITAPAVAKSEALKKIKQKITKRYVATVAIAFPMGVPL